LPAPRSLLLWLYSFFPHSYRPHRYLHSFPTRRSSDLQGRSCNTAARDAAIARALSALNRTLLLKCSGIPLEALGFPGSCSDPDGGVFTPSNLVSCINDAVQSQVDIAVMVEYPDLQTLSDAGAHCQSTIGGEGRLFMS